MMTFADPIGDDEIQYRPTFVPYTSFITGESIFQARTIRQESLKQETRWISPRNRTALRKVNIGNQIISRLNAMGMNHSSPGTWTRCHGRVRRVYLSYWSEGFDCDGPSDPETQLKIETFLV